MEHLLTIGELAARLGQPVHRLRYLLLSRDLKPEAKAGSALVYSETTLDLLRVEIDRIDRRYHRAVPRD